MLDFMKFLLAEMQFNYEEFAESIDKNEPEYGLVERYSELINTMYDYVYYMESVCTFNRVEPCNLVK